MRNIRTLLLLLCLTFVLDTCTGGRKTKGSEEADDTSVEIASLSVKLQFPANASDLGFYDVTYTLSSSPKAQGPFNKVSYSPSEASSYTLQNISVDGNRSIEAKVEDGDGLLRYKGSGAITETSTEVTIELSEEGPENPSACDGVTAKIKSPLSAGSLIIDSGTATQVTAEINIQIAMILSMPGVLNQEM